MIGCILLDPHPPRYREAMLSTDILTVSSRKGLTAVKVAQLADSSWWLEQVGHAGKICPLSLSCVQLEACLYTTVGQGAGSGNSGEWGVFSLQAYLKEERG